MHPVWSRTTNEAQAALGLDFFSGYAWGRAAALGEPAPAVVVQEAELPKGPGANPLSRGDMAAFVFRKEPEAPAEFGFLDGTGKVLSLKDWQGKVVLLNFWATWCAPCRKEMPALDRLQQGLGGDRFAVVAVATDRDIAKPRKFLADNGITGLTLYHDEGARLISAVQGIGMPTTLLFGKDGREIGRLVGPAEWDSEDAKRLIVAAIEAAR